MRWSNLDAREADQAALPGLRDAVVRRFDAPEALETRFYEVHAKSALNRVPERSRVPFRWTINPYRGCSHACTYCASGDTLVLMGDGSTRRLAELRAGDEVYGTELLSDRRRYVRTRVLDHWPTFRPAHRIALEDGTELVASADHRFLTARGWEHVAGGEHLRRRDLRLTVGRRLLGPGRDVTCRVRSGSRVEHRPGLRVASVAPLGFPMRLYDITTGTGDFIADGVVSHNCFARPTHTYLGFDAGRDFEKEIVVKVNVPEVLRAELRRPSWKGEHVAIGTNTDPYQWVEGRYRLMPGIWEALRDARNPASVLTKSPLVLRDLALMRELGQVTDVSANLSVPTLDEKAWRATEPHTPNPRARLEAVAELNRAGIPTGVLVAPLMPGINDAPEQVEALLTAAEASGAVGIGGIALHLRGETRGVFLDWLGSARPDLVDRYERLYARGAYAPPAERERLRALVGGRRASPPSRSRAGRREVDPSAAVGRGEVPPAHRQESLF
ncbi:MAG TPA: radical SAM protein [Solirubrobacteraceae bacterium]|nr:radical SAM protein [Solirubrobacteraceae bacterium]